MKENFTKIIRPCKTPCGWTFCTILFIYGNLSIIGVEGPTKDGNCKGACGQIVTHDWDITEFGKGWSSETITKFRGIWNMWHLNDMTPGTPRQMDYLRTIPGGIPNYSTACKILEQADLLVDDGYKYGSKWLREEVPDDVIEWLMALPDSPTKPAWV